MISLAQLFKHEVNMAWKRWQIHRCRMPTGLGDSGWILHGLVRSMKPEVCVEIGSAHGYSTFLISLALHQNLKGHLWAVDPHQVNHWSDDNPDGTLESLRRNLWRVGVHHRVDIVQKNTADAIDDLPKTIDFAFIDGDHSYEELRCKGYPVITLDGDWGLSLIQATTKGVSLARQPESE